MKQTYSLLIGLIKDEINKIEEIFEEIILGRFNISKIELVYDELDLTDSFVQKLASFNFILKRVKDIGVEIGFRVPAFYLKGKEAYFGWVFWEIFTETKKRKLFASAIKNQRSDWEIQIPEDKDEMVYVNEFKKIEIDLSTMAW